MKRFQPKLIDRLLCVAFLAMFVVDLASTPEWTTGLATSHIVFREDPVGRFIDWHPAPRRQFVIILSGALEIGFGDGTTHVFGPGDARLVEDTTGKGHRSKAVSKEDRTSLWLHAPS